MEERRFDDLTRVLGAATTRRQVLKGILGAAFGAVLASATGIRAPRLAQAALADCGGITYDPTTQCCEPAGPQPRYPIADLDLCPNRVPHSGHVPSFNGCGPAGGLISHLIPNRIGPFRNIDFTPACNNHDICYDTCNNVKDTCDSNFLTDLRAACAVAYPGRGLFSRYMRAGCHADAYLYYTAVARGGADAYDSAQKLACDCCAGCEECGGSGDERCCHGLCHDACPEGKERDPQTCECKCAEGCKEGEQQDPDTCECKDLCANLTCTECHTCDHDTGNCIPANDLTACGSGQVCCGGECKDDCSCPAPRILCDGVCCPENQICVAGTCQAPGGCDPACGPDEICCSAGVGLEGDSTSGCVSVNDYKVCSVVPMTSGNGSRGDWVCCPVDQECCGGTGYFYNLCGGSTIGDQVVCCEAPTTQCGAECCDPTSQTCLDAMYYEGHPGGPNDLGLHCCPDGSGGVLWDGTCCTSDQEAVLCKDESGNITGDRCVSPGGFC